MTKPGLVDDEFDEWTHAYEAIFSVFGPPPHENLPAWTRLIMRERAAAKESAENKLAILREAVARVEKELRWAHDNVLDDLSFRDDSRELRHWNVEPLADALAAAIKASEAPSSPDSNP